VLGASGGVVSDPVAMLVDAIAEYRAELASEGHPGPRIGFEYDVHGRLHTFTVLVTGVVVAEATAISVEKAAREARERFEAWADNEEPAMTRALEVSIATARAERAAGIAR
jgi:hypothetical protein